VDLFASLDVALPWTTEFLLSVSGFILDNVLLLVSGIIICIITIIILLRIPSVRLLKDRATLHVPIIGSIIIERGLHHFCQTAAMLLQAGLQLAQVMDIAALTNKNPIMRQSLREVKDKLVQGEGLSQPLSEINIFPPLLAEMVQVGEKTGTMDATLSTLATYYEERVDRRINMLVTLIEPLLTLVVGLLIIFVALSIITPLYSVLNQIS
jgi:type IV pilus assembly protein PilC